MKHPITLFAVSIVFLMLHQQCQAGTRALFLGIMGEGAPAIERSFDRALRDRLTTTPDISAFGFDESQRFRRMLDLDRSLTVSEGQLNALDVHLPDSVFIVWAQIKKLSLAPARKSLIRVDIHGELQTLLTVYNMSRRSFSYRDIIESTAAKQTGFIFFSPITLETISAADREELVGKLINSAVTKCTDIIDSLRRSEHMEPERNAPEADTTTNRQPSISDVFTVPSVEAAEISGKKSSSTTVPAKTGK